MKCKYDGTGVWAGRCIGTKEVDPCPGHDKCKSFKPDYMTNADRIRAMSDEELARWIHNGVSSDHCDYCEYNNGYCDGSPCRSKADAEIIVEWLKQPYICEDIKSSEYIEKDIEEDA